MKLDKISDQIDKWIDTYAVRQIYEYLDRQKD